MISIANKSGCCGCTACESICPTDAITMKSDVLGFLYPEVDAEKCVDCHLCKKVCAFHEKYDTSLNLSQPEVYGARHKNMAEVETSRSGGTFIAISDYILEQGGVVYGVGYGDHFRVMHKRAVTKEQRDEFKGSKYVQSDLRGIFRQVKRDLVDGYKVLFSGTPCQTAGLNSFVGSRLRQNLVLVDVVCHGVPGPTIWEEYLRFLEKREGSDLINVNFRDKAVFGWTAHKETFEYQNTDIGEETGFTFLFYKHIMFRHSCGKCHYCNTRRPSDITIADFWGWEKTVSDFNVDDKGVSLVLVNTQKGQTIWGHIRAKLNIINVDINNCLQPNLCHPSEIHSQRMQFEHDFARRGFKYVFYKYGENGWRYKIFQLKGKLRRQIGAFLRKLYLQ
ncbi:MAG: Coenzyme F420 hydrogenase/dehydrogenase, beta subunit C-terminal domain [Muribaculaceae bacterium]|nr:Coenzyme F420 hydrogenase/dehydrogenase, beta subunit C-terminal domain [Muribaculaceae bacterium]